MTTGKHATEWHKKIAVENTVLRTEIGSVVHGTNVSGYDDRDEMGICVEPAEVLIGLKDFEQYEYHTAWDREGGKGLRERSGHGDLDETVYSLRKWVRLAANGNPSVLIPMFAPPSSVVTCTELGAAIRSDYFMSRMLSQVSGKRFSGYLHAQRRSMLSHDNPGKGRDVTRPELIEKFGYDTKFAGHMVRLGYQGVELLTTGTITLPMPDQERRLVMGIREGNQSMENCLRIAEALENELNYILESGTSVLPAEPDWDWINKWLALEYRNHWYEQEGLLS